MSDLHHVAKLLGGDVVGAQILCPGPRHSAKDRSLSVRLSPSAPDGFVVHSHSGDDPFDCKDHVRHILGWGRHRDRRKSGFEPRPPLRDNGGCSSNYSLEAGCDGDVSKTRALQIWRAAVDPRQTLVERYLHSRGLDLPWEVAGEPLRFHPACPWREPDGEVVRVPAMIAALRSFADENVVGVHRTRIDREGRKVDRRMLGQSSNAAIMLASWSSIGGSLTVAEGIESALAGWKLGWSNVWALGSAGAIAALPVFAGTQSLAILAEDDETNRRAADAARVRYLSANREVFVIRARSGGDANDIVRREITA